MPRSGFGAFRCARPKSDPQAREAFGNFAAKVQADLPDAVRGKKIEVWFRHKARVGRQGAAPVMPYANTAAMTAPKSRRPSLKGAHAILAPNGPGRHGARALRVPDNITAHAAPLMPPYVPQINPVENIRAYLRANKTAISVFNSYHDIVDRRCKAWNVFANKTATVRLTTTRDYTNRINI